MRISDWSSDVCSSDLQQSSPEALHALGRIAELYAIEAQVRGGLPEVRRQARQARAGPRLNALHDWLHNTLRCVSRKSDLAGAIRYALTRWAARSEEHTSELQSLMRISYAVFCLKKKKYETEVNTPHTNI